MRAEYYGLDTRHRRVVPLTTGETESMIAYVVIIACGIVALIYGAITTRQVLAADAGNARMQEISAAVRWTCGSRASSTRARSA